MLDDEKTILNSIRNDRDIKEDTENKLKEIITKVVELNK